MKLSRRRSLTAGLDVGSRFVRLVLADHSAREPQLVHTAMEPVPPGAVAEGEIVDRTAVARALRILTSGADLSRADVHVAVGGRDVIVKRIAIDRMNPEEAREVIQWDAWQHVPFDKDSVRLDFQVLDPGGVGPTMSVLLVAAKRDLVDSTAALLVEAGLSCNVVDVDAFALHNALERNHPEAMQGLVALADIGHDATRLLLLSDGLPILVRHVPVGVQRLAGSLDGHPRPAADRYEAAAVTADGVTQLEEQPSGPVGELVAAVQRAIAFAESQGPLPPLGSAYLCGGGALVPGVLAAFGSGLGVRSNVANPIRRVPVRPDVLASLSVDQIAPTLMLPVGLALRRPAGSGGPR